MASREHVRIRRDGRQRRKDQHGRSLITDLRCQPLEQRRRALVLDQVLDHRHTRHLVLEVRVLDARLDRVQRRRDGDGRNGARDRRDEVLAPGRLVVVLDAEQVLLRHRGRAEELDTGNQHREIGRVK